jgi:DMSO/TMAO reductase YedYZ molybdopterin-dependent catalytic subunit
MSILRIEGCLAAARRFDFATLRALPDQQSARLRRSGQHYIVAVSLAQLIALVGVDERARSLVAESTDGKFVTVLPIAAADSCIVAYRIDDAPLPRRLGGPICLVVYSKPRCVDVKDLGAIFISA